MARTNANRGAPHLRPLALDNVITTGHMKAAWKTVRQGLRSQDVLDLHDYHDFHRSADTIVEALHVEICSGLYRPRRSQQVRLEKTVGICRRLHIPSPEDAVILQTLADALEPAIRASQPSLNAFYSRTHTTP